MLQAWFRLSAIVPIIAIVMTSGAANAVVIHSGVNTKYMAKPNSAVVGRAGASAVAISPNHALTAAHVGVSSGSTVTFGSTRYRVSKVNTFGSADLKLLHLKKLDGRSANLGHYTPLYTKRDEWRKTVVVGGNGAGRGSTRYGSRGAYGYYWGGGGIRFGSNKIDGMMTVRAGGRTSAGLMIDFDPRDHYSATRYESAMAGGDSGGGWFINDGGKWKLAGLAVAVQRNNESRFKSPYGYYSTDKNYAVRISSYADAIVRAMGGWSSYNRLVSSSSSYSQQGYQIPEPATLGLLGAPLLLVRRRARRA